MNLLPRNNFHPAIRRKNKATNYRHTGFGHSLRSAIGCQRNVVKYRSRRADTYRRSFDFVVIRGNIGDKSVASTALEWKEKKKKSKDIKVIARRATCESVAWRVARFVLTISFTEQASARYVHIHAHRDAREALDHRSKGACSNNYNRAG